VKENKGILIGHGGIKCRCCQPVPGVKASRIAVNRAVRRLAKINIRKEVEGN
jgi:hypothetical protein